MAPRILSLLTILETALRDREAPCMANPATRMVSFHRSVARLTFSDGSGDILLHCFVLADGQLCMKLQLRWTGSEATSTHSLYPQGNYQWEEAIGRVADAWMEGPPATPTVTADGPKGVAALEHLVAAAG